MLNNLAGINPELRFVHPYLYAAIMGLNLILVVIVIIASSITILQTLTDPVRNSRRWLPISTGILLFTATSLLFWRSHAGYISIVAWVILAVIPSLGFRFSDRLFYQGNFAGARRVKNSLRWLHPLADWKWQEAIYYAYEQASQGKYQEASLIIEQAQDHPPTPNQICMLFYFRQDWSGLKQWWESEPDQAIGQARLDLARYYLRALGELGKRNKLLQVISDHYTTFAEAPAIFEYCLLYAFAFCGRTEQTSKLLHTPVLESINADTRTIWIATAHDVAGNREMANALLKPLLRTTKDGLIRRFAEQRLHYPLYDRMEELTKENKQFLQQLENKWTSRQRLSAQWQ